MSGEDAASRKRRLQELRNKAKGTGTVESTTVAPAEDTSVNASITEQVDETEPAAKKPKFRNYQPFDKKLIDTSATAKSEAPVSTEGAKKDVQGQSGKKSADEETAVELPVVVKKSILEEELENAKVDEINLVPKKVNADLKQQVAGKLEKLKRRTQKAIVEILREKLSMEAIDE